MSEGRGSVSHSEGLRRIVLLARALQDYRHAQRGPGQADRRLAGVETDVVDDATQGLASRPLGFATSRLAFVRRPGTLFGVELAQAQDRHLISLLQVLRVVRRGHALGYMPDAAQVEGQCRRD